MIGRHRGGGRFGGGPFGGGDDMSDFQGGRDGGARMGRMFGHGDLRLLLLALIEKEARHGYELIRVIEEMSGGAYTPSPGAIYPTLTLLEEAGYAEATTEGGNRKQYRITDQGREYLATHREAADSLIERMDLAGRMASKMSLPASLRAAFRQLKGAVLTHPRSWDPAETARVIEILERAAADIAQSRNADSK
ncbi:PadR family transcriptional regulator [Pararobbsia silviterrae]|uniref:PadR family transcriptional regulator n=2 Tax=Pararobbsia silviterrae TaxID=1792498 RepID=A0A494XZQ5_9BURK|nr:PadR family transcriptional regulator [Pararobbsia silviterrae]